MSRLKLFFLSLSLLCLSLSASSPSLTGEGWRGTAGGRDGERLQISSSLSCTSILAGPRATTDGSVITSHTCDSWYRTWMKMQPAADYPRDTVVSVWDGRMHTRSASDRSGMKELGTIPQARHTFRYLDTAYPCLNEHQLAMGETTFSGRDTLRNPDGLFRIEELQRIAMERCTTAREAIRLMGRLIKEYGYGDSGECLTIADPHEAWYFEVLGEGPKKIGGVWAAVRIPDDHVAVSANVCRIGRLDLSDSDHYMASDNVRDVARRLGLWDGKSEFSFWRAYAGENYFHEVKNYSTREHFILSQLAPSLCLSDTVEELPLSVRPDSLVSPRRVSELLASYYEGTPLSVSCRLDSLARQGAAFADGKNVSAFNPWLRPDDINAMAAVLRDSTLRNVRTVSVPWCAYSTVIQCRAFLPDSIGGVAWLALDNPGQSPRFPIFSGTKKLPALLATCGQHGYDEGTALWRYRRANRLATVRWAKYRKLLEPQRDYFLQKAEREQDFVVRGLVSPTDYTADFFAATVMRWDDLYRTLWDKCWTGF